MSAALHVLLEAEACFEGDVADGKADPPACLQLGHVSVLQYLEGWPAPWSPNMCLYRLDFLENFCSSGCTGPVSDK